MQCYERRVIDFSLLFERLPGGLNPSTITDPHERSTFRPSS